MTTPPTLRIYRGLPVDLPGDMADDVIDEPGEVRRQPHAANPLLAVLFSGALHLLVLGGASFLAAMHTSPDETLLPGTPERPLHLVFVSFILAQCGLGAILFARSSWSLYAKALITILALGALWLLLIGTLQQTRDSLLTAQAWAAGIGLYAILVISIVSLLELALHYEPAAARSRFGLLHVLSATTLVAIALGIARNLSARQGFVLADVIHWPFFQQVQLASCTSAALAVAIYTSLRLANTWSTRSLACGLILLGITIAAPLAFKSTFGNDTGATLTEMRWLFGTQGLFLLGTLLPLQALRDAAHYSH
jgi:hypothetical protein